MKGPIAAADGSIKKARIKHKNLLFETPRPRVPRPRIKADQNNSASLNPFIIRLKTVSIKRLIYWWLLVV